MQSVARRTISLRAKAFAQPFQSVRDSVRTVDGGLRRLLWSALVLALAEIALALANGVVHDYRDYLSQWANTVAGRDPWSLTLGGLAIPMNAYGPVHAVVGYLILINPLAPKLAFVLSTIVVYIVIGLAALRRGWEMSWRQIQRLAIAWPLSPLALICACVFGLNDSLVALFVILALEIRERGKHAWSGLFLGLGALLKFYPLLFVPLICLGRQGIIHVRGLFAAAVTFTIGMAAAYGVWGPSVLSPLAFGAVREAKMLSPISFLESLENRIPISPIVEGLKSMNAYMVVGAAVLAALHGWCARLDFKITALLGIGLTVFTYKVGHYQFYLPWTAVIAWVLVGTGSEQAQKVARSFVPAAAFLGAFSLLYLSSLHLPHFGHQNYLTGPWGDYVRDRVAVPFTAALAWGVFRSRKAIFVRWQKPAKLVW
jgi:hypothetical protein